MSYNPYNNRKDGTGYPSQAAVLPRDYLKDGYCDAEGSPRRELFLDWAEELAATLKREKMTPTALRNFFNEAKTILSLVDQDAQREARFGEIVPRIHKLRSNAHYASQKRDGNIPPLFYSFIQKNHALAERSYSNLKMFVDHFECVVGYFKER